VIPSGEAQTVPGSRSRLTAGSGPVQRQDRERFARHRPRLVERRHEPAEHHEVRGRVLAPGPAQLAQQVAEAARAQHAPRQARREDPGRLRVEVHLVAEAQRVAGDALVPGLADAQALLGRKREPAGELEARVRARHARAPQRVEHGIEPGHLPHAVGVRGVAPGRAQDPMARQPGHDEPRRQDRGRRAMRSAVRASPQPASASTGSARP
jgi:hypothetical protein